MSIIQDLKQIRRLNKISQKEMAKHLDLMPSTLNRYEKENRHINFNDVLKYADYLGYEIRLLKKQ